MLPLQVSLSSLNRHAVATRADVGLPKATVLKRHFHEILPEAEVNLRRPRKLKVLFQCIVW